MRLTLLCFLTLAFSVPAVAQFSIGYNVGYANPKELNRIIYQYNATKPHVTIKKRDNILHFYPGQERDHYPCV
ncbi:MAG: hypothetical protein M3Q97_07820 [Bacteroidota bacterium]|nr:hypothetical protein [Bacteroidota bacterium]